MELERGLPSPTRGMGGDHKSLLGRSNAQEDS